MADEEFEGFGFDEEEDHGFGDFGAEAEQMPEPETGASESVARQADAAPGEGAQAVSETPTPSEATTTTSNGEAQAESATSSGDVLDSVGHGEDVRLERSGWLRVLEPRKTLSRRGGLKERWFNLQDGVLKYSSSVTSKPISTIDVGKITSIVEHREQPEAFTLIMDKKSLDVIAREEADARSWVASLRKAQKSVSSTGNFGGSTGSALLF
ncbi:hypothetical protein PTSG_07207 [Salpingoeca rosetta]|uniref:PH domain-containing protein n=1 Tax=Salpingoeca rosetta (strain ATCC 50818 / BSB-021) TaxID=946362 RepID=F2UED2_SALR5|nr:uncharacterized protein PTSG_07207 [Salpingoeca rosetta]EGD74982.1 hypothetical protein PTSG_07207 [Salpingoeca rosetta]|eukprot:XP_004992627.1 hypothetical protein PTSG_07207 [Salpingoeca rosetta]